MKRALKKQILLGLLLGLAILAVHLPKIQRPFLGHYSSYELVMASMARNMAKENFSDFLHPKTDLLVNGKRSLHLNQYPFSSLIAAMGVRSAGGSFEFWGRFQSMVFNLLSVLLVGLIASRLFNSRIGWLSALIYAFSPYALIYGQKFISEPMALCALLFSLFLLLSSENGRFPWMSTLLSGLFFSLAVTNRVHFILFFPVWFLYLLVTRRIWSVRMLHASIFSFFALAMPVAWYGYTLLLASDPLYKDHILINIYLSVGPGMYHKLGDPLYLFNPNYYKDVFNTVSQTMLTPLLFPFPFLGIILARKREKGFWFTVGGVLLGALLIFVSPRKVAVQDFYLYGLFPFLCFLAAAGIDPLLEKFSALRRPASVYFFLAFYLGISARYFAHPIFKYPEDENQIKAVRERIESETRPEDVLIISGNQPAIMAYYADRPVVTLQLSHIGKSLPPYMKNSNLTPAAQAEVNRLEESMKDPVTWLEYLRSRGASYFLALEKEDLESVPALLTHLEKRYKNLSSKNDDFLFIRIAKGK